MPYPTRRKNATNSRQGKLLKPLVSKGTVYKVLKKKGLKCFPKVKCHALTEQHPKQRAIKADLLKKRFGVGKWKMAWFEDE